MTTNTRSSDQQVIAENELREQIKDLLFRDGASNSDYTADKIMQLFAQAKQAWTVEARIDELTKFEPLQQTHDDCPMPTTCVGYQNAVSDFDNEKVIRLKELNYEPSI